MGDDYGYSPKPPPENHPFWTAGSHVNSERFFITDELGTVEVDETVVWNEDYVWVDCIVINGTTVYLFEFSG